MKPAVQKGRITGNVGDCIVYKYEVLRLRWKQTGLEEIPELI